MDLLVDTNASNPLIMLNVCSIFFLQYYGCAYPNAKRQRNPEENLKHGFGNRCHGTSAEKGISGWGFLHHLQKVHAEPGLW